MIETPHRELGVMTTTAGNVGAAGKYMGINVITWVAPEF